MPKGSDIRGPDKAAIFLMAMGEEYTAEVFAKLDDIEIKRLGRAMSRMRDITPERVNMVIDDFTANMTSSFDVKIKGDDFVKKIITRSIPGERAEDILEDIGSDLGPAPFENLRDVDPKVLGNFIISEHPQTIALILAHIDSNKAAEILTHFPENLQIDVMLRIADLESVPLNVINEIESVLQSEITAMGSIDQQKLGGIETVAEILNQVDQATENAILSKFEEDRAELANEIRKLMFVFDDLVNVDDRGIRSILREVNNDELTLALKTASESMKEKIFGNLSERAASLIKEDLEIMGPVKLADVEKAQQSILKIAKRLEGEGQIMLGKGGEEVFV